MRIKPNPSPDAKAAELLKDVEQMFGGVPNIFSTLAHSSAALGTLVGAFGAMSSSKLSGALREQIALAIAGANGCDYCASAHSVLGKMNKLTEEQLAQSLQGRSRDPKTQEVLSFALKVASTCGRVSDADLEAVRAAGYSDEEIVDIVTLVGINIFTNYFNHVVETDIDFPLVKTTGAASAG